MSANSAPGFKQRPDYRIATRPAGTRVQVTFNGEVIADSRDAVEMKEGEYRAVYHIPRKDVKMYRLVRSNHQAYCPYKGTASYYSFRNGAENAVWSYEEPYDEMGMIKGLLAFYPDKVDSIALAEAPADSTR